MNASNTSQKKDEKKFSQEGIKRIKESKWGTSGKYLGIKHPWNESELARTLRLVKSTNNTKIKINF